MKTFFSICMSLLVLIGTFSDAFVYITFKLNQDYIAQELCVNLDEPELMCRGKCFLNDQLAKVNTEQRNSQTPHKFEKKDIPLYFKSIHSKKEDAGLSIEKKKPVIRTVASYYEKHLVGVFHPPQKVDAI